MQLRILTWNGHNIQDTTYKTSVPPGQLSNLQKNGVSVPRTFDWPALATSIIDNEQTFTFNIQVISGEFSEMREQLKGWFSIVDYNRHYLVAEDTYDSNRQWYLVGIPIQFVELKVGWYAVTLQVEMKAWRMVEAIEETPISLTASGQYFELTNLGNVPCKPLIAITPTTPRVAGGYLYSVWVPIYSQISRAFQKPFDLTNGGFDTATLVAGGDMLASGDDIQILIDGVEVDRWLGNMNAADTKIWVNLSLSASDWQVGVLGTSIASSGDVFEIALYPTVHNRKVLANLASAVNKVVLIDDEAFVYESIDLNNCKFISSTNMRAKKNTAMAAHTDGVSVRYIEHDIWFNYGNPDAVAPTLDDTQKPIFDLDASTNTSWVYTDVWNYPNPRPGSFITSGNGPTPPNNSFISFGDLTTGGTGVSPGEFLANVVLVRPWATAILVNQLFEWTLYHPCGIDEVVFSGDKYISATPGLAGWPSFVGLRKSTDGNVWADAQTESAPASVDTWDDFGPTTVDLLAVSGYPYIRFFINAQITSTSAAEQTIMIQWDTITVNIVSAAVPVCVFNAEIDNNPISAIILNTNTGEYLTLNTICKTNTTILIDCENKKVTYEDGTNRLYALGWSPGRSDDSWLDCPPGLNEFQYIDVGMSDVDVAVTHRDRMI